MSASPSRSRVERLAPWVTGLLLAAPVLLAYYPPMTDVPNHEASVGLLRHFGDEALLPAGLYQLNLGEPNQLFHMVAWALSLLVSTRWAIKLVVAAAVIAIPVAEGRFARHLGASPLVALAVAPVALGWLFAWGLIANLVGLAALLAMLPVLDRFSERPTARGAFACAGAVVLLYFAHEAMLVLFGGTALALALLRPFSRKDTSLRLGPFVASVSVVVAQLGWQRRYVTASVGSIPLIWGSLADKLRQLPWTLLPQTDPVVLAAVAALSALVLASMVRLRRQERMQEPARASHSASLDDARARALAHRWALLGAACVAAYFVSPETLNGATLIYHRWLPPGFALLAAVCAPRDLWTEPGRVARVALAALPVATLLATAPSFADSDRQHRALAQVIEQIEPASAVATVDLGPADPTRRYSLGAAGGRILATRGGRLAAGLADSTIAPVVIPARYQWREPSVRMLFDPWSFLPAADFRRFRYLLVHASDADLAWVAVASLDPEARYTATSGEWMLFESRLPVVPLVSEDVPVVAGSTDTLRARLMRLLPAQLARRGQDDPEPPWPEPMAPSGHGP